MTCRILLGVLVFSLAASSALCDDDEPLVEQFKELSLRLDLDEAGIVKTDFGFHIIKVTDKQAEKAVPLDEVRPQLQQFLENQSRQEATQALIKSLAAKGKIEVFI